MGASLKKNRLYEPRVATFSRDWRRVYKCSLQRWSRSECVHWGFDNRINYTSDPESRLHPWSVGGRHLAATTVIKDAAWELFDLEEDEYSELRETLMKNKILVVGEKFSGYSINWYPVVSPTDYSLHGLAYTGDIESYFRKANVIGVRNDHLVVQIVRKSWTMEFLVLHRSNKDIFKVKAMYIDNSERRPFLMEAYLSPDYSKMLLKPSLHYSMVVHREPVMESLKFLDIREDSCVLKTTMFPAEAMGKVIAFDPRFHWRRLAVGNCRQGESKTVMLCDLDEQVAICENDAPINQMTQNLVYSPDGRYLGSLVVSPCTERGILVLECILLYNSDNLRILHRVHCPGARVLTTLIPTGIFPLFSHNGLFLAAVIGRNVDDFEVDVVVHSVPPDLTLQNLARIAILKKYDRDVIHLLPLPRRLKEYLQFKSYMF